MCAIGRVWCVLMGECGVCLWEGTVCAEGVVCADVREGVLSAPP